jgi:hypothetical protein
MYYTPDGDSYPPMSEELDPRDAEDSDDCSNDDDCEDSETPARYRDDPAWNDAEAIRRRNAQIEDMMLENAIWPWLDDESFGG